ncbi:MAG: choice-of-anchor D domain-containing protein [Terriglobia bacterium]
MRKSFEFFHFTRYFLIRLMASLTCLSAVLALGAVSANAQNLTTYTYRGGPFYGGQPPYTTGDSISGQLTTTSRIPANYVFGEFQNVLTWSFFDGVNTYNSSNSQVVEFAPQTDSQGNLTSWFLQINGNVANTNYMLVSTNSIAGTLDYVDWTGPGGQAGDAGFVNGSWSVSTPPATVNFGSENVGTPAPVQTLTYTFGASATLSGINILTLGVTGLDYVDGGSSTCALGTAYTAGQNCTVTVAFTPSAPGPRAGAVTLFEQGDTLPLITWYLSGLGEAGVAAIDPATQSTLASISDSPPWVVYGLTAYGAGNLDFLSGVNGYVVAGYNSAFVSNLTVASLVQSTAAAFQMTGEPDIGIAADGAGNLFITSVTAIAGLSPNEGSTGYLGYFFVLPNENGTLNPTDAVTFTVSPLNVPQGVAVDSSGNVYLADTGNGRVLEFGAGGAGQTTVASGLSNPRGVAVDAAGNLYVACDTQVFEYPVGGGSAISLGSGYTTPEALAVDPSGALYVADTGNARVVRIPAGGGTPSVLEFTGLTGPQGVTVDPFGNVFVTDLSQSVYELNRTLPVPLNFGTENVGSTSAAQTVTVSNPGSGVLDFGEITTSGDFALTNNCGGSLPAGESCTLNVTFTPTTGGARYGTLTISDNSNGVAGSMQTVTLTGTGTATTATASLSPASVGFGAQVINVTSSSRTVTLTSTGTAALSPVNISLSGANMADFAETNNCSGGLAPGAKCTITLTFTPSLLAPETATLNVADNALNSPQTVSLLGTGVAAVVWAPQSLSFNSVAEGSPSASQSLKLTNNQSTPLSVSSIGMSNKDYAETDNCVGSVAAKGSCTITVTLTPSLVGTDAGMLSVNDNASGSPQTIPLTGTGVAAVSFSSPTLGFGTVGEQSASAPQTLTLTNKQTVALNIASIAMSNKDYTETDNCVGTVAAKGTCTITVTLTPTVLTTDNGTLTVNDSAFGGSQSVSLTGTGVLPVSLSATTLAFGNVAVKSASAPRSFTLMNQQAQALTITSIVPSPSDYKETDTCNGSVAAKGNCTITVTLTPSGAGADNGTLTITDNASNSPQTVTLTGAGIAPVSFSAATLAFGNVGVSTPSPSQSTKLTNNQTVALNITSLAMSNGDYKETDNCVGTVAAKGTCTITVTLTPSTVGTDNGTLSVNDDASGSPQTVALTGAGRSRR